VTIPPVINIFTYKDNNTGLDDLIRKYEEQSKQ
jgi:hypothetical protein